ncbi:DUF6340 family protein [Draconibacterium halophilum]|uniref:Tetratricopeptide repeat protein n=1 Tax=Draconibacterium halophilum TaxID=2706887 RepID=A0A6C0RDP9_9BACT|nr:DUF6340 family protein [Draconibacterium halophilum]QIA08460.1 tetratricopeptide repeat protein [Draconibacterium halophilum]
MKNRPFFLLSFLMLVTASACNTLYNIKTIDIEIVEPSSMSISTEFRNIAIQYNNVNSSPNSYFNRYEEFGENKTEVENSDSIASHIYFENFIAKVNSQAFFDTLITLDEHDYSTVAVIDTIDYTPYFSEDSTSRKVLSPDQINVLNSGYFLKNSVKPVRTKNDSLIMHPQFGLYTPEQLQNIRNTTGADMLLSLDFFGALDGSYFDRRLEYANEQVTNWTQWSFYDLINMKYVLAYSKIDTVGWMEYAISQNKATTVLPPRNDAIYNAAEISAENYALTLVPHWVEVQRMYYNSGHVELQQADELVENGQWLEAAKLWRKQTKNENENIVAKCMFNLGLACEMEGDLEAALAWVVKSYHVFGQKNELHAQNSMEYIRLLSTRQADMKILERQFGE